MAKGNIATPKSEASQTAANQAAQNRGDVAPLPVTQDQALSEEQRASQMASDECKKNGGMANVREMPMRSHEQEPQTTFEQDCEEIGKGIKKLCEAGMGGKDAGELAMRMWEARSYRQRMM